MGSPARDARLLERESELTTLEALIGGVAAGHGTVVLVEGPPGIGKTRLLDAARELAALEGIRVLSARASELEADFPFGIVRQLFEPTVAQAGEREALFTGAAGLARPLVDPTAAPTAGEDRFVLLHGLYWLTVNLSERSPLLLAVDDVQWCDASSLDFLGYLARRLEDLRVGLVAALRIGEPLAAGAAFDAVAAEAAERVEPGALSEAAAAELLETAFAAAPEPAFVHACHHATGGNPLLLRELARALLAAGTPPVAASAEAVSEVGADAVAGFALRRLRRLPDPATDVARALAVLGDGTSIDDVAVVTGLERSRVADVAGALVRADLLRPGTRLEFMHPLVRDGVYATMSPSERERTRADVAEFLVRTGATPERVAIHILHAAPGAVPDAVEILREAARRSLLEGAPAAATAFLERAMKEPLERDLRGTILCDLGAAQLHTDARTAAEHLRAAGEHLDDEYARARASLLLGDALYQAGDFRGAIEVLETALAEAPPSPELQESLEHALGAPASVIEPQRVIERVGRLHRLYAGGEREVGPVGLAMIAWYHMDVTLSRDEALAAASAALAGDVLLREETNDPFVTAVTVLLSCDDFDAAAPIIDRAHAYAAARGSVRTFAWAARLRADLYARLGRLDDAEAEASAGLAVCDAHGIAAPKQWLISVLADILTERGRLQESAQLLAEAQSPDPEQTPFWQLLSHARLALARGRPEEALPDIEECLRRYGGRATWGNPSGPWRSVGARILAALGRRGEALEVARAEVERARRWGAPRPLGHALCALAKVERDALQLPLLEEAVAVLEESPAQLERAHALAELGSALRRAGRRADARTPLYRALELAHICGAIALEATVREELVVAGARPRRRMVRGIDALTPSERRVAQLASSGLTNKQVAQTLFVTLKTVEMHLANTYRKLDIQSRTQLPDALAG